MPRSTPHPPLAPPAAHKFNMPQKNTSTFMSTSLAVPEARGSTFEVFATRTNHHLPHTDNYMPPKAGPANGAAHYRTSSQMHYNTYDVQLKVPPGKGGVDMTRSTIPLADSRCNERQAMQAHTASMFRGEQPSHEEKVRKCASRSTLGAGRTLNPMGW